MFSQNDKNNICINQRANLSILKTVVCALIKAPVIAFGIINLLKEDSYGYQG